MPAHSEGQGGQLIDVHAVRGDLPDLGDDIIQLGGGHGDQTGAAVDNGRARGLADIQGGGLAVGGAHPDVRQDGAPVVAGDDVDGGHGAVQLRLGAPVKPAGGTIALLQAEGKFAHPKVLKHRAILHRRRVRVTHPHDRLKSRKIHHRNLVIRDFPECLLRGADRPDRHLLKTDCSIGAARPVAVALLGTLRFEGGGLFAVIFGVSRAVLALGRQDKQVK
mmetsp:Transcript_12446/g.27509  ORF Transcript_12446/g.27509 Transcript_12446/m.27509 type:complete len:220 (+) Transcript_12446:486-1145(+)